MDIQINKIDIQFNMGQRIDLVADLSVSIGILAVVLHPTFASLYGPSGSRIAGLVALALLAPAARQVHLGAIVGLGVAGFALAFLSREITPVFAAMAGYAVFDLVTRRPRYAADVFYAVLAAATFVAFLQMWMPPESAVNFHATAVSKEGWLNQIRPTSIFPSQVYLSQFQLLCVGLAAVTKENRPWVYMAIGLSCAFAGSTGGLAAVMLALLLFRLNGWYSLAAYVAVVVSTAIVAPWRFAADGPHDAVLASKILPLDGVIALFSKGLADTLHSVITTRVSADEAANAVGTIAVSAAGAPNLGLIAIKLLAIGGAMLFALILVPRIRKANIDTIAGIAILMAAIGIGQAVLPAIESLYFSLSLGVLIYGLGLLVRLPSAISSLQGDP